MWYRFKLSTGENDSGKMMFITLSQVGLELLIIIDDYQFSIICIESHQAFVEQWLSKSVKHCMRVCEFRSVSA